MSQQVSAQRLADVALSLYQTQTIPFKSPGTTLAGMDSAGFIHYCFKQLGITVSSRGTNTLYRQIGKQAIPLRDALIQGRVVPGAIVFRVRQTGKEPSEFRGDGIGDADYAYICINSQMGVYPSFKDKQLISTRVEAVPGKANMIVFAPQLSFEFSQTPVAPPPSYLPPKDPLMQMIVVGGSLRLRNGPSKAAGVLASMPEGTKVDVLSTGDGWVQVRYRKGKVLHEGWADQAYLNNA